MSKVRINLKLFFGWFMHTCTMDVHTYTYTYACSQKFFALLLSISLQAFTTARDSASAKQSVEWSVKYATRTRMQQTPQHNTTTSEVWVSLLHVC